MIKPPCSLVLFTMSLRSHLDRYCLRQAMARDSISPSTRSRSPMRAPTSSTITSPFYRPQRLNPPATTPHRAVILKVDLKPMQQLADKNPYFNIMAPKVAGNISTEMYESLFQTYKVIYPDYTSRHFVTDLKTLVMDTMLQRWSIHLQSTDFYLMIDTDQGTQILDNLPHSFLDILNWYYPNWQTHQHLDAFTSRSSSTLMLTPHPDPSDTGLLVQIQGIPRGHPFFSPTRSPTLWDGLFILWPKGKRHSYAPHVMKLFCWISLVWILSSLSMLSMHLIHIYVLWASQSLLYQNFLEHGDQPLRRLQRVQRPGNYNSYNYSDPTQSNGWLHFALLHPTYGTHCSTLYDRPHHFHQEDYLPNDVSTWWTLDLGTNNRRDGNLATHRDPPREPTPHTGSKSAPSYS